VSKCGLPPVIDCLVTHAQYTVLGTVLSTNLGDPTSRATPTQYNATMRIDCLWSSFSQPISSGAGLIGTSIVVTNWGSPKAGCPVGFDSKAELNVTKIYYIYVAKAGKSPAETIYGLNYVCVGGLSDSSEARLGIANVLQDYPSNDIRTSSETCQLPTPNRPKNEQKPDDSFAMTAWPFLSLFVLL
jgi:hypothetical protein